MIKVDEGVYPSFKLLPKLDDNVKVVGVSDATVVTAGVEIPPSLFQYNDDLTSAIVKQSVYFSII